MTTPNKRDNDYWMKRLKKDGHDRLLARILSGEITVYRATQLAGYRKKQPPTLAGKLSFHWKRASAEERKRFVKAHLIEINRVGREALAEVREQKTEKSSSPTGK